LKELQIKIDGHHEPALRQLAQSRGKIRREPRGNIKELIEAIATEEIPLGEKMSVPVQEALLRVLNEAVSNGLTEDTQLISEWLAINTGANSAISVEAQRLAKLENDWVRQVKELIRDRRPFQVVTPRGSYSVLWAEFWVPTEGQRRRQLLTWCEESSSELPELTHNRTFKLNRQDVTIVPLSNKAWRYQGIDTINAIIELRGSLARTYQPRPEDVWEEIIQIDNQVIRRVTKKIWSTFWLFQSVSRYWSDCVILAPNSMREHFLADLEKTMKLYREDSSPCEGE
jgi:hypothetical protein